MQTSDNALNWFEIPVTDMARAKHFYQMIFGIHMDEQSMPGMTMATFPYDPTSGKISGGLVKSDYHVPSLEGTTVYLNANPDLSSVIERIEAEGGKILMPKSLISAEIGYMAFFVDSEGNRVGLFSKG